MINIISFKFVSATSVLVEADVVYDSINIDTVYINDETSISATGPDTDESIVVIEENPNTKHISEVIDLTEYLKKGRKHMLYVSITWNGVPPIDSPCELDKEFITKATADGTFIYNNAIRLIKCQKGCGCMEDPCKVSTKFANFALEYFKMCTCIDLGKNTEALESFERLVGNDISGKEVYTSKCHCNE